MEGAGSTRSLARLLIGILCVLALILILAILSDSRLNQDGARAVGMAVATAAFSLTGTASISLARRRPELAAIGYVSAVLSLAGFLAVSALLWGDQDGGTDARVAGVTIVLALGGGHLSVLLGSARPTDPEGVRLLRATVIVCLAALCLMAVIELTEHGEQVDWRLMGVIAVLYVLGSILLPVVRKAASEDADAGPAPPSAAVGAGHALGLDHVVIAASDPARSIAFYQSVLGAQPVALPNGRAALRFGAQQINVHTPGLAASPLAAVPVHPGGSDLCFVWPGPIETAAQHLSAQGVEVEDGPVARAGARGTGLSVYCRDPDGSLIELISYWG